MMLSSSVHMGYLDLLHCIVLFTPLLSSIFIFVEPLVRNIQKSFYQYGFLSVIYYSLSFLSSGLTLIQLLQVTLLPLLLFSIFWVLYDNFGREQDRESDTLLYLEYQKSWMDKHWLYLFFYGLTFFCIQKNIFDPMLLNVLKSFSFFGIENLNREYIL